MRAASLVAGLLAAFLLGLVLVEPRLEPIWAESEEPPLEEPFPVEPEQVGPPVTTELHAGLWRVDGGFVSTIRIKNSLVVAPLEVTPVLYLADGTPYTLPPVSLPVSGVATVNINEALAVAPPEIAEHISPFGSAALRFTYPTRHHVLGSIEVLDLSGSLIFTYPFSGGAEEGPRGQTLEGVWWRHEPEVGGFVALANTTDAPATASIQVLGSRGTRLLPDTVELAPHSTVLLDLDALAAGLPGLEDQAGGIRVQFGGRPGDILVTGGLVEPSRGYSANLRLWPRSHHAGEPAKNTYAAVGLMVGAGDVSAGFPGGTIFSPYAVLRNTTSKRLTVRPEVSSMAGSQPVTRSLPPQQLLAFETRRLAIEQFLPKLGLKGFRGMINFAATFEGQWDDLLLTTGSTYQSGNFVFEVESQGVGASFSKEGPYWKAADGFDTVVTLWSPTDQAQDFLVTFHFGAEGEQYKLPVPLAAKASRTISVAEVIAAQRPDADGNVIPLGTREGSMVLSSAKGMTKWMTLVASTGILNVAAATCGTECWNCCGYSNFRVSPDPGSVLIDTTGQCEAQGTYCNGQVYSFTGSSSWTSNDPALVTVNNSTQKGLVTGIAAGTTSVVARFTTIPVYTGTICMQPCPTSTPQVGSWVTCQKPSFLLKTTVFLNPTDCPQGTSTCYMQRFYRVLDQNQNPILKPGMAVRETITDGGSTCSGTFSSGGEPWLTDSLGRMITPDNIFWCCGANTNCSVNVRQQFTVNFYPVLIDNGDGLPPGIRNTISITCSNGTGSCPQVTAGP
jgi:hypothetical protein